MRGHANDQAAASTYSLPGARAAAICFSLTFLLALIGVLPSAATAQTVTTRPLLFSFDGSATPQGSFSTLLGIGVSVDESTGHIYVNDSTDLDKTAGHSRVDVFDASGAFLYQLDGSNTPQGQLSLTAGIAVDNTGGPAQGNVYVSNEYLYNMGFPRNEVDVFDSTGTFLYQIDNQEVSQDPRSFSPIDLAVGPDGQLLIFQARLAKPHTTVEDAILGFGHVFKYNTTATSATFDSSIDSRTMTQGYAGLAADGDGQIYVLNEEGTVEKRDATTGQVLLTYPNSPASGLAIDRASGNLFISEGPSVSEYSPAGVFIRRFAGTIARTTGMTFDEATGRLIVVDPVSRHVDVYGPPAAVTAPDITLGSTTPDYFEAGLSGTINPQSVPGAVRFEYRVHGASAWRVTPLEPVGEGNADVPVSVNLSGLVQNTEYDLRILGVATESGAIVTSPVQTFKTNPVPLPKVSAATGVTTNSATLHGSVNPQGVYARWQFEYSKDGSTWVKAPSTPQDPGSGSSDVAVSTSVAGLDPNTKYQVRLSVTYLEGGIGGTATSTPVSFTTGAEPPRISLVAPTRVTDTAATLKAAVDARHSETTYYFEYGPDESYGTILPLGKDGDAGSALGPEGVLERLEGLQPETTYHFRVTAENQVGSATSSDFAFTTRSVAEVKPPERGIELVSSLDKGNQNATIPALVNGIRRNSVSRDGNRLLWTGGGPTANTGAGEPFLSERTSGGWLSRPLTPPPGEQPGEGTQVYGAPIATTPDLTTFLFKIRHGVLTSSETWLDLLDSTGQHHLLADVVRTTGSQGFSFPFIAEDGSGAYQYTGETSIEVRYVSPFGEQHTVPAPACGAELLGVAKQSLSRLLLRSAGDSNCGGAKQLYTFDPATGSVQLISAPAISGPEATPDGIPNVAMSADGATVIYITATALVAEDTDGIADVYRWKEGTGNQCLTCAAGGIGGGAIRVSRDFSHVYMLSSRSLVPGASRGLYVWSGGEIRFIVGPQGPEEASLDVEQTGVSADGNTLLFHSREPGLTADRLEPCDDGQSGGFNFGNPCSQFYLYSDKTRTLECVSCPDRPQAVGAQGLSDIGAGADYGLSEDGSTAAFVTAAALTQKDVNQTLDVYEWRNGVIRLVTDGVSEWPNHFLARPRLAGASADGRDLFFTVGADLTGEASDRFTQAYDARAGGGFPAPEPPAKCSGDSCQGPLQPSPPLSAAGSAGFVGPGNRAAHRGRCHRHRARHPRRLKRPKKKPRCHGRGSRSNNHSKGGAK